MKKLSREINITQNFRKILFNYCQIFRITRRKKSISRNCTLLWIYFKSYDHKHLFLIIICFVVDIDSPFLIFKEHSKCK